MEIVYKRVLLLMKLTFSFAALAQNAIIETPSLLEDKIFRVNLLSPGVGLELKTGKFSSLNLATGITYMGSVNGMDTVRDDGPSGWNYSFEPFIGVEQKFFYNLEKRNKKGKSTAFNSANFVNVRSLITGPPLVGNLKRQSDFNFMFVLSWGFQRSYNRIHFLLDAGPLFVFDAEGNSGFFPAFVRLNLGYNF